MINKIVVLIQEEVCELIWIYRYFAKKDSALSKQTYTKELLIDYITNKVNFSDLNIVYNYLYWWKEHANKPITLPEKTPVVSEPQRKRYWELKKAMQQYNDMITSGSVLPEEEHLYDWKT